MFAKKYIEARREVIARCFRNLNSRQVEAVMATEGPLLILAGVRIYQAVTYTPFTADAIPGYLSDEERIADAVSFLRERYGTGLFDDTDALASVGLLRQAMTELYGLDWDYVWGINTGVPAESEDFFLPWGWDDAQNLDRDPAIYAAVKVHDPALVAEKINFSYITSSYYPDWEAFCAALGYDASRSLEEIAETLVADGSTARYTNLGLAAPETVSLSDYVIELAGAGTNDMGGFGAGVYVSDNAVAELNNFRVITRGPGRGTLFTRFGAVVTVNDSTFYGVSDETLVSSQGCPPGLFLEGKVRATNAVGASNVTYNGSVVISQGWGALSTDSDDLYTASGEPTELHINDSYIAVLTSGYGAYSDGGARDYFTGTAIDVPDYAAVETGSGIVSYTDCVINSGEYGVMTHSGNSTGDIVFTNTELHVGEAGVMLRDTANKVVFDGCTIAFDGTYTVDPALAARYGVDMADVDAQFGTENGVDKSYVHTVFSTGDSNCIVKLIHNSDGGSGTESTGAAPKVTVRNSVMAGDILNTAAMTGDEYTATSGPAGEGVRTPRSLDVTLDGARITGAISLGQDTWEVTHFASGDTASQEIGYAAATLLGAYHEAGYGLDLTLKNGAVWTVDETSFLTSLTVEEGSSVDGSMTVDGVPVELVPGVYTGSIVLMP